MKDEAREKIFVISDVEMGRGDIMDDFSDDRQLALFTAKIVKDNPDVPITLVLNGDIFDFLKMAYKGTYPRHVTEEVSAWKLEEAIRNHPQVFSALKDFLRTEGSRIHFVIGNHDADLVWPSLQATLRGQIGGTEENVTFDYWYKRKDLHVEHGHLCDPFFSIKIDRAIVTYRRKKILNTPFGANICFSYLVDLKKRFPREERIFPKHLLLDINPEIRSAKKKITKKILLKDVFIGPLLRFRDPTRRVPYKKLLGHFLRYGTDVTDDARFLPRIIKKMIKGHPDEKVYVLGHSHLYGKHEYADKTVFVTDTWRDEYQLERGMAKKPKSYVELSYEDGAMKDAEIKVL